jgi:hypothetical protein
MWPRWRSLPRVEVEPNILTALSAELRRLERIAAARAPLEPERAIEPYGLTGDVRDALEDSSRARE